MVTGERLAEWLGRLVRVPSVSPDHAGPRAGTPGEARMAEHVSGWFRDFGGEVAVEEVAPGRPNVFGIWQGQSDRWAALDVHMDTVSVEQMAGEPFSGDVRGGRVYGRGAVDTKATLGVVLALLENMHGQGVRPGPNLLIAATVDEEVGGTGAQASNAWIRRRGIRVDQLAVAEPTGCGPVIGHKGVLRVQFHVEGAPAHSSQPHLGKNAITAAAHLVLALDEESQRLRSQPQSSPLGPGTLTVTVMHGGCGHNVVPDRCAIAVDRRLVPGEEPEQVASRLTELAQDHCPLPFTMERLKTIRPFSQSPDAPWVRQLAEWSGREPAVVPYCTNAWAYAGLAPECVVIGPGSIDQAHGEEEWVEIAELEKLAGIYAQWWGLGAGR